MNLPLRGRLALTYAVVTALLVTTLSTALYVTMARRLSSEMDQRLQIRAGEVYYAVWPDPNYPALPDLRDKLDLSPLAEFNAPSMYVQVLDRAGALVGESDNLHGSDLPMDAATFQSALDGKPVLADIKAPGGATVRALTEPVLDQNPNQNHQVIGVLRVSQSREPLEQTLSELRLLLLALGSAALAASAVAGWIVASRGLRPLTTISDKAAGIAADRDFTRRLAIKRQRDEVGVLAGTIDRLLETVDDTFSTHRQFLADTSHELRNPLAAIRTNLDLLDRLPSADEREECLREARGQVERMSRLVGDLLLLAHVETGLVVERRPVELMDVVVRAVHEARLRAAGQQLRLLADSEVQVTGDEGRLLQIFLNLLDNALKHTPSGGHVEVHVGQEDGWAVVSVRDTGAGIPAEHLDRVFERAYRVNPSEPGPHASYGLGLAIVKYLTDAHGGQVSVASDAGRGSCFTVRLPLARSGEEVAEPGAIVGETPSTALAREPLGTHGQVGRRSSPGSASHVPA